MTQVPGSGRAPRTEAEREAIRSKLRRAGLTCIIAGLVLVAIGLVDALITEERSRIWMILAGIPLSAVGGRMLSLSNLRAPGRKGA